jgi:predicted NBD/HSP70 family sugar kinase
LKGVLVDLREEVLAEEMRVLPHGAGNRALAAAIRALLASLPSKVPDGSELVGAGLSLVGTVDARSRTWVGVARWPKLRNLDVSALESPLEFPLILQRTNDVELAYALEAGREPRTTTAVLLHWGFGIGSAVSFRGTLLTSSLGRFGEIGHTRLDAGSRAPCLCGARGCLETRAALWALLPALQKRLGSLPEDEKELASILGESRIMDLREVTLALDAIRQALLVLYKIFYPDSILLSGPLMENPDIFRRVEESFLRSLPLYARGAVKLSVIPGGMPGCRRGGAHPLFRNALARTLRRSS